MGDIQFVFGDTVQSVIQCQNWKTHLKNAPDSYRATEISSGVSFLNPWCLASQTIRDMLPHTEYDLKEFNNPTSPPTVDEDPNETPQYHIIQPHATSMTSARETRY
ncbi:hypothetical protein I7I51_08669 [Histoplasma capsulatum]|uniref:Uncharacterized protein n=1 Tax=Ajellomyces capsulatus TaxID=5037 RepID=A0A8A1LYH6_AJECA|nr:hypothetical protein I7I51_08669 [Histoplasma capsulatum]